MISLIFLIIFIIGLYHVVKWALGSSIKFAVGCGCVLILMLVGVGCTVNAVADPETIEVIWP